MARPLPSSVHPGEPFPAPRISAGILALAACLLAFPAHVSAGDGTGDDKPLQRSTDPQVNYAKRALQGYNLRYWLSNQMCLGQQAWDGNYQSQNPPYGMEYPAGGGIEHLFGGGVWIGAIVNGSARVTEGYNGDNADKYFRPDPQHLRRDLIWQTSAVNRWTEPGRRGFDDDGDGVADEDDLDGRDNDGDWAQATDDVGSDGIPDSMEVGCRGGFDALSNPDPDFDNYAPTLRDSCRLDPSGSYPLKSDPDIYTEMNGIPDHGEPNVDEDYAATSDNDLYCTASDTNDTPAGHFPMGATVTQRSYAWRTGSSADAISILEYTLRNDGTDPWVDPFVAFFADPDVGPANSTNYWNRNFTCFIDSTRTAFVQNPVDLASTPFGISLLSASTSLDSLKLVYQWYNFSTNPSPGTVDSVLYWYMTGGPFPDDPIQACSPESNPSDVRFLLSVGPFPTLDPGEEVTVTYALLSGGTVDEMAANASRAKRILEAGGFIPPVARVGEIGTDSVTITWDWVLSPYGLTDSYRVFFGTAPSTYTDSLDTDGLSATVHLPDTGMRYFAVAAFDDLGYRSAVSDEISLAPPAPGGFTVTGEQRSIDLRWNAAAAPDIAGYNVYRATGTDSAFLPINPAPLPDTTYRDTAVSGALSYRYVIATVNGPGFEGPASVERTGRLIPPAVPSLFVVGPAPDYLRLEWDPNVEGDLAGYNVYRAEGTDTLIVNPALLPMPGFTDSAVVAGATYQYFVEAVDSSGATSRTSAQVGSLVTRDRGVLAVVEACGPVFASTVADHVSALLAGFEHATIINSNVGNSGNASVYAPFSTVIWVSECMTPGYYNGRPFPIAMRGYVAGGGRLLVVGPAFTTKAYPNYYRFLDDYFDLSPFVGISPTTDFAGATGSPGFPSVAIDIARLGGRAGLVETFPGVSADRVLYRYLSDPADSAREGKPVGIRAAAPGVTATYFSFPLYYLDSTDAAAMLRKVLTDYGEILVDVADGESELPSAFRLYDAYPNPFNPATTIRFDVPRQSRVRLALFDVLGRELMPLLDEDLPPGRHELRWNASGMASGTYYVRMAFDDGPAGGGTIPGLRKLLLVK